MKSALRDAICRINVLPSGPDAKSVSRGTGFLVAPNLVLTALHVVAERKTNPPTPHAEVIQLEFPAHKTSAVVHEQCWDCKDDWVLLRCENPPPVPPLALSTPQESSTDWLTFGFPDANPRDGMVQTGNVENFNGSLDGSPAYQLYSRQAAAGRGAPAKGLSGGPVIVGQQVIGLLRFALMKEGETVAGTLYGCPVERAVKACPTLLKLEEPLAPTKLETLDLKMRQHRSALIGAVAVMALILVSLATKMSLDAGSARQLTAQNQKLAAEARELTAKAEKLATKHDTLATMPFQIEAEGGPPEEIKDLNASVVRVLEKVGKIPLMDPDGVKRFLDDKGPLFDKLEALHVGQVLEGKGVKKGNQYFFTLKLTEPAGIKRIWSDDLPPHDASRLHELPAAIAAKTVEGLKLDLSPEMRARVTTTPTKRSDAFAAFSRGNVFLDRAQMHGPLTLLLRFNDQNAVEMALAKPQDWTAPIAAYRMATDLDPEFVEAWARLAQGLAMQINSYGADPKIAADAENALAKAEKLNATGAEVHIARGHLKYRRDVDYRGALADYLAALGQQPNNGRLLLTVGLAQLLLGENKAAIERLKAATTLNPENWPLMHIIAETSRREGDYVEARRLTDRAVEIGPRSAIPYIGRASLLIAESGDIAAANVALHGAVDKGLVSVPDLFRALTLSSLLFRVLDADLRAKIQALKVEQANGEGPPTYWTSYFLAQADMAIAEGNLTERKNNFEKASFFLEMGRAALEKEPWFLMQVAIAQAGLGKREAALKSLDQGAEIASQRGDAICVMLFADFRLVTLMLLGDRDEILRLLATRKGPTDYTGAWLRKDPLFAPLHADPEFIRLTSR